MCLQYKSFENTVGKGEIARNEQFLIFPQCFLPVWISFYHLHQIQNCRLQTLPVWKGLKFVLWERFKREFVGLVLGHDRPKSLKLVVVASPLALRIIGIALKLARQCQYNGLVKNWLKLDKSKILSSGNGLILKHHNF